MFSAPDERLDALSMGLQPEAAEFNDIIYRRPQMKPVVVMARRLAVRSVAVLIEGESATGKELLARAIHHASLRSKGPFVAVNCGAIPKELLESEFFGHERGAFTGANIARAGHFDRVLSSNALQCRTSAGAERQEREIRRRLRCLTRDQITEATRTGRFGRAVDLRRRLTHIQLSGRLADLVYSMDTTNTDFYAHQYKPVLSFLEPPSRGLLIADEVGLGKTIEAGLIWTELRARVDARRLLVVCPKMLCDKWRLELRNRFGVDAAIVGAAELADELARSRPQFPASQAMFASMQGIRPPLDWEEDIERDSPRCRLAKVLRAAAGQDPLLDLVIIDEAHYMRNPETATHQVGRLLREVAENVVLLSATPINLKSEDLFSLLNLVDADSFAYREQFEHVLAANEPLVRARLAALAKNGSLDVVLEHLLRARSFATLAGSKQLELLTTELASWGDRPWCDAQRVRLADRIERMNSLSRVLTRTCKAEVTERKVVRDPRVRSIEMASVERELYALVTQVIKQYAWENDVSDGFLLATLQRQLQFDCRALMIRNRQPLSS